MADTNRLIAEVAARNGVRIDANDPAFCVVTLTELILQEAANKVAEDVRQAADEFARAAEKVQIRTGTILAQQIREALATARRCLQDDVQAATAETTSKLSEFNRSRVKFVTYWIATGVVLTVGVFVAGVLVGWAVH